MKSGRFSPISSPRRTSINTPYSQCYEETPPSYKSPLKSISKSQKSVFSTTSELPPPPYVADSFQSPSIHSATSVSSSKFSSLLQYLDEESSKINTTTDPRSNSQLQSDDISTLSYSPSKQSKGHQHSFKQSNKYVWDNMNFEMDTNNDDITYFSIPCEKTDLNENRVVDENRSTSYGLKENSIQSLVSEISMKVRNIKQELKLKSTNCKELQAELLRLKAAYSRRVEKTKKNWDSKRQQSREEQSISLKKQEEFINKLTLDISQLKQKIIALNDKKNKCLVMGETTVNEAKVTAAKNLQRAQKQWEHDEKQSFLKLAASKEEAMQKAAADSMGPKLERLVTDLKDRVRAKEAELTKKCYRLRAHLEDDLGGKVEEARCRVQSQLQAEEDRERRAEERRALERQGQRERDESTLRENHKRELQTLENTSEVQLQSESEILSQERRQQIESDSRTVRDEATRLQRELDTRRRELQSERDRIRKTFETERSEWQTQSEATHRRQRAQRIERAKETAKNEAILETERVLQKLREEVLQDRERLTSESEAEVQKHRLQTQERLDKIQEDEQRLSTRHSELVSEVKNLRQIGLGNRNRIADKSKLLQEMERKLSKSIAEKQLAHDKLTSLTSSTKSGEQFSALQTLKQEVQKSEICINEKEKLLLKKQMEWKEHIRMERGNNQVELNSIKERVATLLQRKMQAVQDAKNKVSELQALVATKNEILHQLRTEHA